MILVIFYCIVLTMISYAGGLLLEILLYNIENKKLRVNAKVTVYTLSVLNASIVVLTSNKLTDGILLAVLLVVLEIIIMATSLRVMTLIAYVASTSALLLIFGANISLAVLVPVCIVSIVKYKIREA